MRHVLARSMAMAVALVAVATMAQAQAVAPGAATTRSPNVEFEMMTWPEVKQALAAGKTTALVYNGGTEQRGPQNVNGGHTLLGREQVRDIALKLGNAIAAPVLPFSPTARVRTCPAPSASPTRSSRPSTSRSPKSSSRPASGTSC